MKRQWKHGSGVLCKALSMLLGVALVGAYGVPTAAFAEAASGAYDASGGGHRVRGHPCGCRRHARR